jgi:hypothetical protein
MLFNSVVFLLAFPPVCTIRAIGAQPVLATHGNAFMDVAESLARAPDVVYSDFVHFTDRGAARVATTLREPLIAVAARATVGRVAASRTVAR